MNMNLDKKIESELKKDIKIPETVLCKVNKAFEEIREEEVVISKSVFTFNKKLVASLLAAFIISGILINPKVLASISSIFKDRGIQEATNNGYIKEFEENSVKNSNVTMNIGAIVSDKNKIGIAFTLKFDNIHNLKDVKDIKLGLSIKDNNGRVLVEHLQEGIHIQMNISESWNTDISNKNNGEIKYYLTLYSTKGELDNINNLSINIDEIKLIGEDVRSFTDIAGEWRFALDLDSNLKEIETIKYVLEKSNDIASLNYFEVMPTGSIINMRINKRIDESIVNRIKLTDESGEKIYNFTNGNMEETESGVNISFMYDLTTFDKLDKIKIIVKDIEGEDIVLNLAKENK
ncbi:hypothetical protein R0131_00335 [Clostridium sp. AL.422]|uniref:hypothetical protein n=1 Tax=Clostridium TaxID=1485 RepID=UPI00293DCEBB|nr:MULTISPECIES: hypothetical protein [unclassified Clostridium]MDV4149275.1 hypothetical protein [Clostridium sp. AL.422]